MTASLGGPIMAADKSLAEKFKFDDNLKEGLALGAAISLLEGESAAEVLSEPSILCLNNKESEIYVGKTQSVKTATTVNNGGTANDSFKREDIGLTLKIKPRLSNDNKVTLEIKLTIENILALDSQGQPVTTKRTVETTAIVQDGEMVLLGGLVQSKDIKSISKVPFFGSIPLLGRLFRSDTSGKEKTTLAVMLTPYILDSSRDLTRLRQELTELTILQNKFTKRTIDNLNNGNSPMTVDGKESLSDEELEKQVVFSQ
jgi:general secretion pathway protein D